jgi:hypothetical protein
VPVDLFRQRESFVHEMEYAWPGMPSKTKLVDLGRPVEVGYDIRVDGLWWLVERGEPPGPYAGHLGRVTATASTP